MATSTQVPQEMSEFFESYRAAFERRDAIAIAKHYAFPAHLVSDTGMVVLVPAASKRDWERKVGELLAKYRNIGVSSAEILSISVAELSPLLLQARLTWGLYDAKKQILYDFDTTYTLGRFDDGLKIVQVISHNELPRYMACLQARQSTS